MKKEKPLVGIKCDTVTLFVKILTSIGNSSDLFSPKSLI